jgi:hypothetical protein
MNAGPPGARDDAPHHQGIGQDLFHPIQREAPLRPTALAELKTATEETSWFVCLRMLIPLLLENNRRYFNVCHSP